MISLEELQISANVMDDDALLYISSPQKLRSLEISDSKGFSHVGISYLAQLKNMQHLKLNACFDFTDECLSHLPVMTTLETLDISACWTITDNGIRFLSMLPRLHTLNIEGCRNITNAAYQHIASITSLRSLTVSLSMTSQSTIDDTGLLHLSKCTRLRNLVLQCCIHVTMKGIRFLEGMAFLQILEVSHSRVAKQNLKEIRELLPWVCVV